MHLLSYKHHFILQRMEQIIFTILCNYLTYLQNGKVTYYDIHVTLLKEFKEFTILCNY